MAIELVCTCGNVLQFEQPPAAGEVRCPVCQAIVPVAPAETRSESAGPQTASGRKALWALMGRSAEMASSLAAAPSSEAPQIEQDLSTIEAPPAASAPAASEPAADRPVRKGLWGVMQGQMPVEPPAGVAERTAPPLAPAAVPAVESNTVVAAPASQAASDQDLAAMLDFSVREALDSARDKAAQAEATNSRRATLSLALGIASIPISFLALINAIWSRFPAPLIGFLAILTGLIATQEVQRSAGRKTGRKYAMYGIIAGIVGSFLGPVVVSGMGRRLIQSSHRGYTTGHLQSIGSALTEYEKQRGEFPPGGIFRKNKAGDQRGYHGWMTLLLPWLGEGDLYAAIRQNLPYDDEVNLPAFEQDVPVFFASGSDQEKVRGRFGVTHFAGVGGEVTDEESKDKRVLHVGLFGMNSSVKRGDVIDGLANTMAAGEIADDLPAWGDPENWRMIGRGLNRDRQGFGNHDRTGACFLMADGSVRYLSNKTDLRILTSLSTRDGGEP